MKLLPSMKARSHCPRNWPPSSTNSSILQSCADTLSRETRIVTTETKRKLSEKALMFTAGLVMKTIKSCRNGKAFSPKDIGGLPRPLLIIQQAQPLCSRESIKQEQHP